MNARQAWRYLLLLFLLLSGCLIMSSLVSSAYLWLTTGNIVQSLQEISEELSLNQIRIFVGINQFISFLVPGLIGLYLIQLKKSSYLNKQSWWIFLFFGLWYLISLPLFQWFFYVNLNLPVPGWWPFQIEAVPPLLLELISNMSVPGLITNLLIIAVLPALGEELIFRVLGINLSEKILGSGHLAVLLTSLVFAMIHLDFQGLLPRFFLGIILGYSFLLSRNFWVPFTIHFLHNGSQILIAYFLPSSVEEMNQNIEAPHLVWIVCSAIALIAGFLFIRKYRTFE